MVKILQNCVTYRDSVYTYLQFLNLQVKLVFVHILYRVHHGVFHAVLGILENYNDSLFHARRKVKPEEAKTKDHLVR